MTHVNPHSRRGFSLVEVLVVVGIIVVLVAIAVPAVNIARRSSRVAATGSLLNNLAAALQAYHNQFNRYPADSMAYSGGPNLNDRESLAQGLMGYLDANKDGAGPANGDPAFGFRTNPARKGEIHGPYFTGDANVLVKSGNNMAFADLNGNQIRYFKASSNPKPTQFIGTTNAVFPTCNASTTSDDGKAFLKLLGDANANNTIDPGEIVLNRDSFLLVSRGETRASTDFSKDSIVNGAK